MSFLSGAVSLTVAAQITLCSVRPVTLYPHQKRQLHGKRLLASRFESRDQRANWPSGAHPGIDHPVLLILRIPDSILTLPGISNGFFFFVDQRSTDR